MPRTARHALLRQATGSAHASLERVIGEFATLAAYERYVGGLYRFRQPLEIALQAIDWPPAFGAWRPCLIADALELDLQDLGLRGGDGRADRALPPPSLSALLGTLYVLEGSALGARLIRRQAQHLGLHDNHGARHLARQANAADWSGFLAVLDQAPDVDEGQMAAAANAAFIAAEEAMTAGDRSAA